MDETSRKRKNSAEKSSGKTGLKPSPTDYDVRMPKNLLNYRNPHFKYYLALVISLATFIVYLSSLQNGFVTWDDQYYVYENPYIRSFNLSLFKWAFFDFYAGNWHPLTWLSHALDYAIWGLNPLGHHLTNNILHALNTFLVVVLVIRLLEAPHASRLTSHGSRFSSGDSSFTIHNPQFRFVAAGVTGLLFGLHPLHVESVAWVAERKDLLCGLFFLLSIMAYTKYATDAKGIGHSVKSVFAFAKGYLLFALFFFVLALLSKPMAVTLPVVLLILDWYPFNKIQSLKSFWSALLEKLPFFALSIISSILTIMAQRAGGAIGSAPPPLDIRILVAAKSLVAYLHKMLLPLNLSPFYPYPMDISLLSFEYGFAVVLVIGISISCFLFLGKEQLWPAAWGYYVITLLPVIGIIAQVGTQSMADRYTYLPSLGPFLIIGLVVSLVSTKVLEAKRWGNMIVTVVTISLLISLSYLTFKQISVWKNSLALWSYVIEKEPREAPMAYVYRGTIFYQDMARLDKAMADFDRAIELSPDKLDVFLNRSYFVEAYYKRGLVFENMGQLDKALADFNKTIELNPSSFEAYYNRAKMFEGMGQLNKAIEDYDVTIALNPSSFEAYNNRGTLYGKIGRFAKAIEDFNRAIVINPNHANVYSNRGITYALIGQYDSALADYNTTIKLDKNYAGAYLNRGTMYLQTGNKEQAVSDFQKACELGDKEGCRALQAGSFQ